VPPPADFRAQIEALRPYLVRYASLQLRDAAAAEDAVQEALLAALAGEAGFAGRANLRTWLTGILKHKIVDIIRRQAREPALPREAEDGLEDFDALFERNGHWAGRPEGWGDPDGALEQAQFYRALEMCLERLPARTARVFMMREHLGLETAEICKELDITPTHCWVLLYRARMTLRECLQQTWFGR
jgi:RNA polymerase sigma-70 factor (ECF subfamily)